jgi:DNA invertase Pin-like site-specific DNA recombinase
VRKANGYDLFALQVDAGLSGKRADNRPSLQTALREACLEPGVALIVYSLSRLARSVKGTLEIAGRLERAGADLVSLSDADRHDDRSRSHGLPDAGSAG